MDGARESGLKMGVERARLTFLSEGGTATPCGTEKQRPERQAGE